MPQTSGLFPQLSDQVNKTIVDFAKQGLTELDPTGKKVFAEQTTTSKFKRYLSSAPFGTAPRKGEGEEYSFDIMQPGYSKDITPVEYGFGFAVTETAQEDDEYDVLAQNSKWLGFSIRIMEETQAALVLNNGFTTQLTADGVSLFNTAHPLKRGGTAKNRPDVDADPSVALLARLRADMRMNTKLESGQLVRPADAFYVVHHPENEALWLRILKSEGLPGSADNDINPLKTLMKLEPLVWEYIDDTNATFLIAKRAASHGLKKLTRVSPRLNPPRQDPKTGNWLVTIRERVAYDAFDWRNVAASSGT